MARKAFFLVCGWMGVLVLAAPPSAAHPGHDSSDLREHARASEKNRAGAKVERRIALAADQTDGSARSTADSAPLISGQGELRFKVLHTAELLPSEAVAVLVKAHGGFAVDRRPGRGEVYFGLPGAGIIRLSGDLTEAIVLRTPNAMKDATLHNATLWLGDDATPYLTFPSVSSAHVFTTTLEGRLLDTLNAPGSDHDFGNATVNEYFAAGGNFVPTDVEVLDGLFYITTGYSALDYVLTAKVMSGGSVSTEWHDLVFGGRGDGPGRFATGHGITLSPRRTQIVVADRPNAELDRFTPQGRLTGTLQLPEGSWPVDVDFQSGYMVVGSLYDPDRSKAAPIYILKDDRIVSTIRPKDELGLENFQHVHNAVMVEITGKLYLIAQAWNPGDFAVLEQVTR